VDFSENSRTILSIDVDASLDFCFQLSQAEYQRNGLESIPVCIVFS
jgi:hypothetical protein